MVDNTSSVNQHDGLPKTIEGNYLQEIHPRTNYIRLYPRNHEHKFTLIWLHGLGDTAHGFSDDFADEHLGLVPATCKVVLPTAPIRAVTCNDGENMTSWYDILESGSSTYASKDQMR